ncbi:hypothetical protein [Jiella pacifica]|uniref:Uncharacterized protein n=1 Tax=Jiella pacifica TaxID=2696469 RepID=A0A6N9T1M1_9HYPH|nr:hypothetical protein [Jiella pacifica]NDW04085.1 hypothetical protein [Jiella pacifica]
MKHRLTSDLGALRLAARDQLDAAYAALLPDPRIQAIRDAKAEEARRVLAGDDDAPLLVAEAASRGLTLDALATLVLDRQRSERGRRAHVETARQTLQAAIEAAGSPAEIESIVTKFQRTETS